MIKLVRQKILPANRAGIVKLPVYFAEKPNELELMELENHFFRCPKCLYWCNVPNAYIVFDESIAQYKTLTNCRICTEAINNKKPIDSNPEVFQYLPEDTKLDISALSPSEKQDYLVEELAISYFERFGRSLDEDIRSNSLLYEQRNRHYLFAGDRSPYQPGRDPFAF